LGAGSDDGFEPDLGTKDGLGDVEEEVKEGYVVLAKYSQPIQQIIT
jgi:hypothetical protein